MKNDTLITRRQILIGGLTTAGGLMLSGCSKKLPPNYGNILRMADSFTYAAHQALLPGESLAREYSHKDISSFPATGTTNPCDPNLRKPNETYAKLLKGNFADWRLSIEGLVARPGTYSLADLKRLPPRTQITKHVCEEGWSAIAEWTGVPLSRVLDAAGILPSARFVVFYSYDEWIDCIDMFDALHPQTLVSYSMNGDELPVSFGGPLRMRVPRQLGYKSVKFLTTITLTDNIKAFGKGLGSASPEAGYAWYAGI